MATAPCSPRRRPNEQRVAADSAAAMIITVPVALRMDGNMRAMVGMLALLFATGALAAEPARARLEAFARSLQSISGSFEQSVTDANGHRGDESRGTLALQAPRQMRWQTTAPFEQTIVADGSKVWVYEPDLEQVSVRNQSAAEAHSPLTVLTDLGQLDQQFSSSEGGTHDGLVWLKLEPRANDAEFANAELGVEGDQLRQMRFADQLGNQTLIRFGDWKRNPTLPAGTFKFVPPKGVDVVGDAKPDAEVFPVKD